MKSKKKLSMWIYNPKTNLGVRKTSTEQFDPLKSSLTRVMVDCYFKKSDKNLVEYTYTHPRLKKRMSGTTSKAIWES